MYSGAEMRNSLIILQKQLRDTFRNKTILIQFILFPVLTVMMENTVKLDGMPEHFFSALFSVMYIGMAPLTAAAAIISEEKEKSTLRVLLMSDVKSLQYLTGVGGYVWLICMLGAAFIAGTANYGGRQMLLYLIVMGIGIAVSVIVGAAIGMFSRSQMMATSIVMPVMMVLSFLPMLSMFNQMIEKAAKVLYTQQIYLFMNALQCSMIKPSGIAIVGGNLAIAITLFLIAYKKNGLE